MTRISKTFLSLSVLFISLVACDPQETSPDEPQIANLELELDIERQLELHDDTDLECSAWPEPGEPLDESADEFVIPCLEWSEVEGELDLLGPEDQVPTGTCNYWQESNWVGTNVKCGANGHLILSYMRDCSQCYPGPVSCGPYEFDHTLCNCTIC